MKALRLQIVDPGLSSLKYAARAAIVMPAVVAFADQVIENPQTTYLAAFGSIAILVLTDFGGPPRKRLAAYLGLAAAGAVLVTLGTLCSRTPWLAVVAMAVIGFAVLLSGVISAYFAAARIPVLFAFILPVSIPVPPSAIPARLEGWALAASVGIAAAMLLWPSRPRDRLRAGAARATRAIADLLDAELSVDPPAIAERADAASAAVRELRQTFIATPYRPTGPTGSTEALAFLVDELDWLLSFATPTPSLVEARPEGGREESRELLAATVAVLRASAANLDGERRQPDLDRLERAREALEGMLVAAPPAALETSFRMRELSLAADAVGVNALLVAGSGRPSGPQERARQTRSALQATKGLVVAHANLRSAPFRNALRGAAGLSIAVLVSQLASLSHAFWVVLATLSVLRSNAMGTGSTVLQAIAGTVAGIVIGGAVVAAVGTDEGVLWALLPPAILLAAYAPRAISFGAGQAAFTVVLLIFFNIIQPTGWTVGLVRVEDVAVGCAVSLVVGSLFWPRGLGALLRQSLGAAYAASADYLADAARQVVATNGAARTESADRPARQKARAGATRLDEAVREYVAESSGKAPDMDSVATLVGGATRMRLAAYSLSTLTPVPARGPRLDRCADALAADVDGLRSWYAGLADALVDGRALPSPQPRNADGVEIVQCARQALAGGDRSMVAQALSLLWASQQVGSLRDLEARLVEPAAALSGDDGLRGQA